jgi:nucleoside 2-deoxyribosyltransferase
VTTIYLAGPINGCNDTEANGWRRDFMDNLAGFSFLDPMVRDYRGREDECVSEIVEGDMADIDAADVFLAYCWQVSWGTAMEILYAHSVDKPVLLVCPPGTRVSPWLRYHSTAIVPSLYGAAQWLHTYS